MATLQDCYTTILSTQISSKFNYPSEAARALTEVDGRSNTIVAKKLDDLHESNEFLGLLDKVSFAYSIVSGGTALTLPSQFDTIELVGTECASMTALLGY